LGPPLIFQIEIAPMSEMKKTADKAKQALGTLLLGGFGGAVFAALLGLIAADVLRWWESSTVFVAITCLGGIAGVLAGVWAISSDSEDDGLS
jgi:succinate-acetate transporter protein